MRILVSALLFLGAATLAFAQAPEVDIAYEKFTLDNGLRVIVHEDRKAPIVAVSVWYHVGSKDEPEGRSGFAHLFEHLMFNGSENYDDEFFGPFEAVGATGMNGTTWLDRTNYFESVPTPALDMALWMESDRMGHLLGAVTQEKLDEQRGVVQNEKRQGENQPYGKLFEYMQKGIFPAEHPYRHTTIGSMEDLNAASLDDVKEWFRRYYGAANTVVVLAGDIDAETARPLMQKYFGDIDAGPALPKPMALVPSLESDRRDVVQDNVSQARIFRAWPIPGRDSRTAQELELAAAVLGDGKNSRLYKELVYDRQLATSASASVFQFELSSGFTVDVMVRNGVEVSQVEAAVDEIVNQFLREGPSRDELSRAKTKLNADTIRGLEQVGGFGGKAVTLAQSEVYHGDPGFWKKALTWQNAANADKVASVADRWLSKPNYQVTFLPYPNYSTTESTVDRSTGLPEVSGLPDLEFPNVNRDKLSNGIPVVLARHGDIPLAQIALQFDAGYAADSATETPLGTSSFAFSMLDEGTAKRSALEISAEAESIGAELFQGSNLDTSNVGISSLTDNLQPAVELLADVVRNPAFAADELERVRARWIAGIQQEKTQPVNIALRTLPPLMYGQDHAYGIPFTGSGTEESIQSLSRDDLQAFHNNWIRPDNATIYVVGNVDMATIKPMLEKRFGNWKAPSAPVPEKSLTTVENPEQSRVVLIDKPEAPQTMLLGGHLVPPSGDERNIGIQAMNEILGGSFTARVNMNLREDKSWAYGAYTFMQDARGQRPWIAYAPVQTDRTVDSIKELQKEFAEYLGDRPAEKDELDRVIKNNTNSLPGQYETSRAVLGTLMSNERFNRPDNYASTLKGQYEGLQLTSIQGLAGDLLEPDNMTWVIVGDLDKIEADVRALDIGPVTVMNVDGEVVSQE